jgi:hypothetical protein
MAPELPVALELLELPLAPDVEFVEELVPPLAPVLLLVALVADAVELDAPLAEPAVEPVVPEPVPDVPPLDTSPLLASGPLEVLPHATSARPNKGGHKVTRSGVRLVMEAISRREERRWYRKAGTVFGTGQ